MLRHVFACRFLQNAIQADANRHGYEIEDLTSTQIAEYAELPLEVLRLAMGHASMETTRIYVEMLINYWIAPRYFSAWNSLLDNIE